MNGDPLKIKEAIGTLEKVRELSASLLNVYREELKNVLPRFRDSSINLIQYLALRQFAGEPVMEFLGTIGLSRLFNV